jgi:hypothetical protein
VVIDVDGSSRPLAHVEALRRQRAQSGFLQAVKQTGPRSVTLAERTLVELHQQLPDRLVEFRQAEELLLPQSRDDPALDDLRSAFYFGLVPRAGEVFGSFQSALDECLINNYLRGDIGELALLPLLHLLAHRFEVALHAVDTRRDAVNQRERLRVFCQHWREHST